jgi:KDO2-lipid IV(A) lauroyltransferase
MQWKIARTGRLSERFNRWAVRRGLPLLAWLAPRTPRGFLHANAHWIIGFVMLFNSGPKPEIRRNLARILGESPDSPRVRAAMRRMFHNFACYWADLFRFAQLPADRLQSLVVEESRASLDRLNALRDAKRKTILITAHLGNWELGSVLAGHAGLPLSVVYVPDAYPEAERLRSFLRGRGGVEEIPVRPEERLAALPVLRAFEKGRLIAVQGDRDWNDRGARAEFLGAEAAFPLGPFQLARMSGAELMPVFVAYAPDRRFEIEVGPPIEVEETDDRERDSRRALHRWVGVLEAAVRRWPTQWYTYYDFWPATKGQAKGTD